MMFIHSRMQDGSDANLMVRFVHFIDDPVGKPVRVTPANVLRGMSAAVEERVSGQRLPDGYDFFHEFRAQALATLFIPLGSMGHVLLDLRREADLPAHSKRRRKRAFMSSMDTAASGSCRSFSSRSSTMLSSRGLRGDSSTSNALRITICRCSNVSAGSSSKTSAKLISRT